MRINVKAFALTCGLVWGFGLFLLTWWIMAFNGSIGTVPFVSYVYRGYKITPLGSIVGLVWAFFDGLVGGAIFAWFYNLIAAAASPKEEAHA